MAKEWLIRDSEIPKMRSQSSVNTLVILVKLLSPGSQKDEEQLQGELCPLEIIPTTGGVPEDLRGEWR